MRGKPDTDGELLERGVDAAAVGAVVLSFLVLLFNVLTHFPFFDETVHVHYLWQLSNGLKPGMEFFCTYPVLGYILTLPLMGIFPESAFVVLALRCVSVVLVISIGFLFYRHGQSASRSWAFAVMPYIMVVGSATVGAFLAEYSIDHMAALAALAAALLLFGRPGLWSAAASAALCTLSVAITPKYPLPLFLGMLGYLFACRRSHVRPWQAVAAAAAGAGVTLVGVLLAYALTGMSPAENFRHAVLLNYRWSVLNTGFGLQRDTYPLAVPVIEFFSRNPVLGAAIVFGIAGWVKRSWRNPDTVALAGGGILAGTLISTWLIKDFAAQYVSPIVLCLALFAPYSSSLVRSASAERLLRLMLVAGTLVTLFFRTDDVAAGFSKTPFNARAVTRTDERAVGEILMGPTGVLTLSEYSELLEVIPPNEKIVAAWPYHPIFRRDQTAIAIDTRPSYFSSLSPGDPMRGVFDPEYFRRSLEKSPPAMIYTPWLEFNYPPGWKQVAEDFLVRHSDMYVLYQTRFFGYSVRRDLVDRGLQ